MEKKSLLEIAFAVSGKLNNPKVQNIMIDKISTDSRTIGRGALFFPITGEKFDGHDFIPTAFKNGAACAVSEKPINTELPVIYVKNSNQALLDFTEYYLKSFDIPFVAVTGSVGKTTTRELINGVLRTAYKNTVSPVKNLNNHVGVPLTAFEVDESTQIALFEFGMNHFGEIEKLSKVVKPDIGVITNIGVSHIENLGSREGILKAKLEITEHMKEGGKLIVNGDDDLLNKMSFDKLTLLLAGKEFYCDYRVFEAKDDSFTVRYGKDEAFVKSPRPGDFMIQNCVLAFAVCETLGIPPFVIRQGFDNYSPPKMRMEEIILKNGALLINDTYNASPDSMAAAFSRLEKHKGKKIAVLGDMLELGEIAEDAHKRVGRLIKNTDMLLTFGRYSSIYNTEAGKVVEINEHFDTKEELTEKLLSLITPESAVLIKASRGMMFEDIAEAVQKYI